MTRAAVLLVGFVVASDISAVVAHEGGAEMVVITGTIHAIDSNRIQIETRDKASFALTRLWVITNGNTRFKLGRLRVDTEAIRLVPGEQITAVATREHTDDYSLRLVALDIALSDARPSEIQVRTPTGQVLSIVIAAKRRSRDDSNTRESR
jgi:hypothetical protein